MCIITSVSAPALDLVPIFRSDTQARVLAQVFWGPPSSGRELARRLDLPQPTVARELARLERAGVVHTETIGRAKIVHPADTPITPALRQLVAWAAGVPLLVRRVLADVPGVDEAFIFGSWAARYHGESGPPPGDIDIAVVSDTLSRFALAEQRVEIEAAVGANVDLVVIRPDSERLADLRREAVPVIEARSDG